MTFGEQNTFRESFGLLDQAFLAGINFFDSAEIGRHQFRESFVLILQVTGPPGQMKTLGYEMAPSVCSDIVADLWTIIELIQLALSNFLTLGWLNAVIMRGNTTKRKLCSIQYIQPMGIGISTKRKFLKS